jgi:hypothetical protein
MPFKKGQSGHPGRSPLEKHFADAIRIAVNEKDDITGRRKLRVIADKLVAKAMEGEGWAIGQVADRLDGKPAQESNVTVSDKRDSTDWTRDELVSILNDAADRRKRTLKANGCGDKPDQIH